MAAQDIYGMRTEEIRSHSSYLTNIRLDIVFRKLDMCQEEAWKNPCLPNIKDYFAELNCVFSNVFVVFDVDDIKRIKQLFGRYWRLFVSMQDKGNQTARNMYAMLFVCDEINRVIKGLLQSFNYFFRKEQKAVKTIEKALEVISEGGGFFGGKAPEVQAVPAGTDKPEQ